MVFAFFRELNHSLMAVEKQEPKKSPLVRQGTLERGRQGLGRISIWSLRALAESLARHLAPDRVDVASYDV
jgi:hypothetical protein